MIDINKINYILKSFSKYEINNNENVNNCISNIINYKLNNQLTDEENNFIENIIIILQKV